ncbi:MAG: metallophosphoesterase, partial [Clostridia bacterium]|nr:metallophosphoesterase [Clostridia bacterium]
MKLKRKTKALILSLLIIVVIASAVAITASAAVALPEEGMSFDADALYEMYKVLQIDEDLTIESELWIDPTSSNGFRGGKLVSNYVDNNNAYGASVVPQRRFTVDLFSNGNVRLWTDDLGECVFNGFDIRTAVTKTEFVNIAITLNVLNTSDSSTVYTYANLDENKDANGNTMYVYTNEDGKNVYCEATLYINGEAKQTMELTNAKCVPGWFTLDTPLCVGGDYRYWSGRYNHEYFKGKIKNLTLYSDIRTADELLASAAKEVYSVDKNDSALCVAYDFTSEAFGKDLSANSNNLKFNPRLATAFTDSDERYSLEKPLAEAPRTYEAVIYVPTEGISDGGAGVMMGNYSKDPETNEAQKCIDFEIYNNGAPLLYIVDDTGRVEAEFGSEASRVSREGWVHLTIVDDGSYYHCYIDGVLTESLAHKDVSSTNVESFNYDIESVQSQKAISIGRDDRSDKVFQGKIKYIACYSEPLSAEEVKASYDNGVDTSNDDLMLYYDMTDTKGLLRDLSGNGYHASTGFYERDTEVEDYAYSFAIVGDTQRQVLADWTKATDDIVGNETTYTANIYKWIVENKDKKNIQWVFGLGDITENNGVYNNSTMLEWDIAFDAIMQMEEAGMNYSVILGNHDTRVNGSVNFNNYFANPNDDFYTKKVSGYYEEGKLDNYYINFEVSGVKYMVLCLEFGPNDKILEWASGIVDAHPERRVIVTTHAYMFSDGTTVDKDDPTPPNKNGETYSDTDKNNGDMMWEKFVSQHRNILMVLSGHETCSDVIMRQDRGVNGNLVSQFLVDPQGMEWESGMVCMFYFSEDGKDVKVEWISAGKTVIAQANDPDAKDILYKATNQFDFTVYDNYNNFIHSTELVAEESDETKTVYRIYYTNGTYSEFVVNHGKDGEDGKDGADGANGADGADGKDGASVTVVSVEKTGTNGLVDTYTITFSDGTTTTFTVTNGADGVDGEDGK